jgi:hypothetical protein
MKNFSKRQIIYTIWMIQNTKNKTKHVYPFLIAQNVLSIVILSQKQHHKVIDPYENILKACSKRKYCQHIIKNSRFEIRSFSKHQKQSHILSTWLKTVSYIYCHHDWTWLIVNMIDEYHMNNIIDLLFRLHLFLQRSNVITT